MHLFGYQCLLCSLPLLPLPSQIALVRLSSEVVYLLLLSANIKHYTLGCLDLLPLFIMLFVNSCLVSPKSLLVIFSILLELIESRQSFSCQPFLIKLSLFPTLFFLLICFNGFFTSIQQSLLPFLEVAIRQVRHTVWQGKMPLAQLPFYPLNALSPPLFTPSQLVMDSEQRLCNAIMLAVILGLMEFIVSPESATDTWGLSCTSHSSKSTIPWPLALYPSWVKGQELGWSTL